MLIMHEVSVNTPRSASHPDAVTLAAYIDRRLPDEARRMVAEHLIGCLACRDSVSGVSRVTGVEARRRRTIAAVTAVSGLAAVLVLAALPDGDAVQAPRGRAIERDASAGTSASIRAWTPVPMVPGARSPTGSTLLAWSPVAPGAQYRISLTDAAGDELWTESTADTTVRLPESLVPSVDADYFWVVDALLPDGATATTGTQRLPRAP
jgi:anti-sigma factor RsiW